MDTQTAIKLDGKPKLETIVGLILLVISGVTFMSFRIMAEQIDLVIGLIIMVMTVLGTIMLSFGVKGFADDGKRPPSTGYD